ncbi:MAG: PPC domain-containing protein [Pseudomonadota bacterium]
MGIGKTFFVCMVGVTLAACRIEITVPEGGRVVGNSLTCRGGNTCMVDVADTSFNETYRAIPAADRFTFTGWLRAPRHFCGDSVLPCALSTALFEGNDALMALLDNNDEVFSLSPVFKEISDNRSPGATPFTLDEDYVHHGELGGTKVSYDDNSFNGSPTDSADWFTFVAPTSGVVRITVDELAFDYDLAIATVNQLIDTSEEIGTKAEVIVAQVTEGETYYILVAAFEDEKGDYRLSVTLDASREADSPTNIAGVYTINYGTATGACDIAGPQIIPAEINDFVIAEDGTFVRFLSGVPEPDFLVSYRVYANDLANGTVIRKDTLELPNAQGDIEFMWDILISGEFSQGLFLGERNERLVIFAPDGSKLDDCLARMTFVGEKVAELDGSGNRGVSR